MTRIEYDEATGNVRIERDGFAEASGTVASLQFEFEVAGVTMGAPPVITNVVVRLHCSLGLHVRGELEKLEKPEEDRDR